MSAVTTGGITVKVLTGRTAAPLQRYRDSVDDGVEPYLFASTRHCSHDAEIQVGEWKAVRELHGTQGARRKPRASFEEVDADTGLHASGRSGTHVEYHDGKGTHRKRLVREGETPTHLRVPAHELMLVKESEAVHTIYAAGPDLIDPDDHQALERFFLAVCAQRDEELPGLQESRWLERNGKSGLVHVHVASNATIHSDFELDGKQWRAGLKMAEGLTRKDHVRARFEQYLDAHTEHGFKQGLARVGSPEYRKAQLPSGQKDYWDRQRGQVSNHERVRRAAFEALEAAGVADHDTWRQEMVERGIEVKEVGRRRGKPTKSHDFSYRVAGTKAWSRGSALGPQYSHAAIGDQLDRKAAGQQIEPRQAKQVVGLAAPLPIPQGAELDELRLQIEELGRPVRQAREAGERHVRHPQIVLSDWVDAQADAAIARLAAELQRKLEIAGADIVEPVATEPEVADIESTIAEQVTPSPAIEAMSVSVAPAPWRSGLRGVRATTERMQERVDVLAQLDEEYLGRQTDAEFEARVCVRGVGEHFLGRYGRHLDPQMLEILQARVDQATDRQAAVAERVTAHKTLEALRARPRLFDSRHDAKVRDAERDLRFLTGYVQRIEAARAEGDYGSRVHERDEHRDRERARRDNTRAQRVADLESAPDKDGELSA